MQLPLPLNFDRRSRVMAVIERFVREVVALVGALSSPNEIIDKVEQMDRLHRRADAIEASEPIRAAELRAQASLILLR